MKRSKVILKPIKQIPKPIKIIVKPLRPIHKIATQKERHISIDSEPPSVSFGEIDDILSLINLSLLTNQSSFDMK